MKIVLCGYNKIGYKILQKLLINQNIQDIALFTHKPKTLHVPDIRDLASDNNIWFSTKSINKKDIPFKPDIIASVYYRYIISENVLNKSNKKPFNIHPSLLPKYRGCSSVPWAIINGEQYTGVTFHYMTKNIDTGNIILQVSTQISESDTQGTLYERCMDIGVCFWDAALILVSNNFEGMPQTGSSSYNKRGAPFDGKIERFLEFNSSTEAVNRFIKAMNNPPYPYASYYGHTIKNLEDFLKLRR